MLVLFLVGPETGLVRALRAGAFDAYQALAPRLRVSAPAVIVAIDDPSLAHYGHDLAQMFARRELRHDAPVFAVHVHLRRYDAGQDFAPVGDYSRRGLVTGRFDS